MKNTKITTNFLFELSHRIILLIVPLFTAPYLSRVLGADGIGIQSYTNSIQAYFCMFSVLGTSDYGTRLISRNRDNKNTYSLFFWEIEILRFCLCGICVLLWGLLVLHSEKYKIYYLILTINIVSTSLDISWFFTGLELFPQLFLRNIVTRIAGLILTFSLIKNKSDLPLYMFITVVTAFSANALMWLYLRKVLAHIRGQKLNVTQHLKGTFAFFLPTIATSVYTVLDRTLIGVITNSESQNGYYEQAEKILTLIKGVVYQAINAVVGVRVTYLAAKGDKNGILEKINTSLNYIIFMGTGCCFGMIGCSNSFVPLFFGSGYDPVKFLLYILCPIVVIIGIGNCVNSHYYTPFNKRAETTKYIIVGSLVNLILNGLLIPKFEAIGAAIASVIAEIIVLCLYVVNSDKYFEFKTIISIGWKKIVSGVSMCAILIIVDQNLKWSNLNTLLFQVPLGALVYIILLLCFKDKWVLNSCRSLIGKIHHLKKL